MLIMKLTALLVSLNPDQTETFKFHLDDISDMPCFSHDRRTSHSMLKILQAIFPTLQYKGRKAEKKGLKYSIELNDHRNYATRTLFYWCFLHEASPTAQLEMNWSGFHSDQGYDGPREKSVFIHTFTFRANSIWVCDRDDDLEVLENIRYASYLLPFLMGGHRRLGAMSPVRALNINPDVLKLIGEYLVYF